MANPVQFDRRGRIPQVKYAMKAAKYSRTAFAMRGTDGVVFGVDHTKSPLEDIADSGYNFTVDDHIGVVASGRRADVVHIVSAAREQATSYRDAHGSPIPLQRLAELVRVYMHGHTRKRNLRPFGAFLVFGSYENDGPKLYKLDPSGDAASCFGLAIGQAARRVESQMRHMDLKEMPTSQLIKEAKRIMGYLDNYYEDVQGMFTWVGAITDGKHMPVPNDVLEEASAYANANPMVY